MRSPLEDARILLELDEVDSTQLAARRCLAESRQVGAILAANQTAGVGRFGRTWHSGIGDSLTATLIFWDYADHPMPHLIGMSVAAAAAGALHCQLQWPNDLIFDKKKVGGILTELVVDAEGRRVPLVGIGINLNQTEFPAEIEDRATSLKLARGHEFKAKELLDGLLERLKDLPEPNSWPELEPIWMVFDKTPGKVYTLPSGENRLGSRSDRPES